MRFIGDIRRAATSWFIGVVVVFVGSLAIAATYFGLAFVVHICVEVLMGRR